MSMDSYPRAIEDAGMSLARMSHSGAGGFTTQSSTLNTNTPINVASAPAWTPSLSFTSPASGLVEVTYFGTFQLTSTVGGTLRINIIDTANANAVALQAIVIAAQVAGTAFFASATMKGEYPCAPGIPVTLVPNFLSSVAGQTATVVVGGGWGALFKAKALQRVA